MFGKALMRRAGALAGLIFVALSGSAQIAVPQMPSAGAPAATVVGYIETNQRALEWTWFLAGEVAWLFGMYFCASLALTLWISSPYRAATLAGLFGAVASATLTISASIPWGLLVYLAPQMTDRDLVLALAESRHFADAALSFSTAGMLLGFSIAAFSAQRGLFRVLGAAGFLAVVLQIVHGADDFFTYGQTGPLPRLAADVALTWILGASALLLARAPRHKSARAAGGTGAQFARRAAQSGLVRRTSTCEEHPTPREQETYDSNGEQHRNWQPLLPHARSEVHTDSR
jgi:hypothetical protein